MRWGKVIMPKSALCFLRGIVFSLVPTMCGVIISLVLPGDSRAWEMEGEVEIRPLIPDFRPGDGHLEEGSWSNPYVIETPGGTYEVAPLVPNFRPSDGYLEEGSFFNPYILRKR